MFFLRNIKSSILIRLVIICRNLCAIVKKEKMMSMQTMNSIEKEWLTFPKLWRC